MDNIKNSHILFCIIVFTIIIGGCKKDGNSQIDDELKTINVNGVTREFILYIPSTYDSIDTVPLMLNFHGWTMSASDQMNLSDMRALAESEKFILAYPQGTKFKNRFYGSTHWNVGSWTTGSTSDDIGFVDKLIDNMSINYNIDLERIYACGYSNGGFFSHELVCNLSNKIAAIGAVSANMSTRTRDNCNPSHPTPVITINGTNDNEVSYTGTNFEGQISHNEVLNYWINYNQTDLSPIISDLPNINTADGSEVKLYQYKNGNNDVEIEHFKVINGGHDWPGSIGNMDIDANSIIWRFVSQFDIHGKIM
tara:strand:- start:187 stop:1113 length:927 start_codon:yes stop_codon:yes gene_type:complete